MWRKGRGEVRFPSLAFPGKVDELGDLRKDSFDPSSLDREERVEVLNLGMLGEVGVDSSEDDLGPEKERPPVLILLPGFDEERPLVAEEGLSRKGDDLGESEPPVREYL